jgi:hypothetical protein
VQKEPLLWRISSSKRVIFFHETPTDFAKSRFFDKKLEFGISRIDFSSKVGIWHLEDRNLASRGSISRQKSEFGISRIGFSSKIRNLASRGSIFQKSGPICQTAFPNVAQRSPKGSYFGLDNGWQTHNRLNKRKPLSIPKYNPWGKRLLDHVIVRFAVNMGKS